MNGNQHDQGTTQNSSSPEESIWRTISSLYRHRHFITGTTAAVAILSVVVSLLLPDWYRASTRVLPPEGGSGSGITAMMGASGSSLGSVAQSFLGQGSGNYMRFISILTSHSLLGEVVDEFDLEQVYNTAESGAPRVRAIQQLEENASFVIDDEYEFLSIKVYDRSPERAAKIANFFVEKLNDRHAELSSQNASNYRRFIEQRYDRVQNELDSARLAKQQFEQKHGVVQLPDQARQFLSSLAELRSETIQSEIQLEALRTQYGPNNTQVNMQEQVVEAARRQQEQMLGGSDVLLPIAYQNLPRLSRQYAEIMQAITIQETILEYVRPLYEQARFDEEREKTAVQVIDPASPPIEPAWPTRSILCIAATLSGFLLAVIGVLGFEWIRRNRQYLSDRIQTEVVGSDGSVTSRTPTPSS